MGFARFFLALMVVVYHSGFGGFGGVYMLYGFYLISGYVIFKSIDQNYHPGYTWVIKFYIKRFLRLVPSFIFASLIMYLFFLYICEIISFSQCLVLPSNITQYINSSDFNFLDFWLGTEPDLVLKISPPQIVAFFGFISVFWSVSLEILFYLLVPIIFMIPKLKKNLVLIVIVSFIIYIYYSFFLVQPNDMGRWMDIVYRNFIPTVFFFSLGASINHLQTIKENYFLNIFLKKNYKYIFIIGILSVMFLSRDYNLSPHNYIIHHNLLLTIVCFVTLLIIYFDRFFDYFSSKFDYFLGELSYPIYLNHMIVLIAFMAIENQPNIFFHQQLDISRIPLICFFSILLSIIFYIIFEKNITKIRKAI